MFYPEGTVTLPSDDELRSLAKACYILFIGIGDKSSPFPEGCRPLPSDDGQRLERKINILLFG